jgi:prenylcysteine oxidase/farnesylcysteine lyase
MPNQTPGRRSSFRIAILFSLVFAVSLYILYPSSEPCRTTQDAEQHSASVDFGPESHTFQRIAIIGAGSGGASTAYYLRKFQRPSQSLNITVFERSDYVGGRSTTVNAYNDPEQPVELGASIFVTANRNLVAAAKEFGLTTQTISRSEPEEAELGIGIWDGKEFKYVQERGTSYWWDVTKLLWKYGLAPIRTQRLTTAVVGKFLQMYEPPIFPFRSLSQAVFDVGLTTATSETGSAFLLSKGIGPPFSTDIVQASTRVNYAQNLAQIHGLETMVCMATDGAMAVSGGNWLIFDGMLKASRADVRLNSSVSSIVKQRDGSYIVAHKVANPAPGGRGFVLSESTEETYDAVVIAAPLQFSGIHLSPMPEYPPDRINYVRLHVTLFTSPHRLSPLFFGLEAGASTPEVVLTTLPNDADRDNESSSLEFFSISTLRKTLNSDYDPIRAEYLYKIFSPQRITAAFLSRMLAIPKNDSVPRDDSGHKSLRKSFSKNDLPWIYEKVWNSYPYLPPRVTFDEPQLDTNLWYTSGIESFISTMETSSLMGMNVARLIVDDLRDKSSASEEEL